MAVNDNNPLYGSFTLAAATACAPQHVDHLARQQRPSRFSHSRDNYWADFLFGTTNAYSLANYFVAHLTQNIAQRLRAGRLEGASEPYSEYRSALGVRLALR